MFSCFIQKLSSIITFISVLDTFGFLCFPFSIGVSFTSTSTVSSASSSTNPGWPSSEIKMTPASLAASCQLFCLGSLTSFCSSALLPSCLLSTFFSPPQQYGVLSSQHLSQLPLQCHFSSSFKTAAELYI